MNRITEVQESEMPLSSLAVTTPTNAVSPSAPAKPKGFSARLLQGFRKSDHFPTPTGELPHGGNDGDDEVEMVLGVELAKALKVTDSKSSSSSATKKLKMLGRYFQVSLFLSHEFSNL